MPRAFAGPPRWSTASARASALRAVTTTRAPSATRRSAMPSPMPREAPVTMATAPSWLPMRLQAQVAADEFLHDLVRPRPDLGDPRIAPGAGHAVLVHEPVAAVELHTVVEDVVLHLGGPPLGLGRVDRGQLPLGMGGAAVVDVGLGDLQLGLQLGDLELVVLERADGLAEGLALLGVLDRLAQDLEGVRGVGHRRADALLRQPLHHRDEAPALLPQPVGVGQADVVEEQLRGVGLLLADLVELAAPAEALHARLDHEQRDALGALGGVGAGGHDDQVRLV